MMAEASIENVLVIGVSILLYIPKLVRLLNEGLGRWKPRTSHSQGPRGGIDLQSVYSCATKWFIVVSLGIPNHHGGRLLPRVATP